MVRFYVVRSLSLATAFCGALANFILAVHVVTAWRALPGKWDYLESEREDITEAWQINGAKLFWALLSTYFGTSSLVNVLGFTGISKGVPSFVRFYRDFSIADFAVSTIFTVLSAYAAFRSSPRTTVCEELARQPELMREMADMGLSLENCELWFERAMWAFLGVMVIVSVLRMHLLVALSKFYTQLLRRKQSSLPTHADSSSFSSAIPLRRIYLLPSSEAQASREPVVYAPVAFSGLSSDMRAAATEAWISPHPNHSSRPHKHHRRSGASSNSTGKILLPMEEDEESLLPKYKA